VRAGGGRRHHPGQWAPGQSGNPSGRPRGYKRIARYLLEETDDGREVADFFLRMMRDKSLSPNLRAGAAEWIANRMVGRAQQVIKLETETRSIDWSAVLAQLPDDVLRQVVAAMESATGPSPGDPPATDPPTALPAPDDPHEDRRGVPAAPLRLALPPAGDPPGDPSDPKGAP
jgi:hypothetical protein